ACAAAERVRALPGTPGQQRADEVDRVSGLRGHRPRAVEAEKLSRDDGAQPGVVRSVHVPDRPQVDSGATLTCGVRADGRATEEKTLPRVANGTALTPPSAMGYPPA